MSEKTPRWLNLVALLLQHRFGVTRQEIFRRIDDYRDGGESARRMFERDKKELKALGIEIDQLKNTTSGDSDQVRYRLHASDVYLPYLELVDESATEHPYQGLERIALSRSELDVLDRATRALANQGDHVLAAAAASTRRKLAFDLPLDPVAIETILTAPIPAHVRSALSILQDAVIDSIAVACRYYTMSRESVSERVLEPWGLIFQWSRWYCIARARDRDGPRLFRVDRMHDTRLMTGADAKFLVPDDFDVRSFNGRTPWEFGDDMPVQATVRLRFPESRWVANRRVGNVIRNEDDATVFTFAVRDRDAFTKWLLSFGRQAELIDPRSLRDDLDALRADVAALYAESTP